MNINSVKNIATKITRNGASLLRKESGLNAQQALQEGLRMPANAATYDAVRVGRNFNHNEHYTDIFTFRNKSGEIVSRYTKKVDGTNIKETCQGFEEFLPDEFELTVGGSEVLELFAKKINSYTRENGKITGISQDVFTITDEAKPVVTHYQKTITPGRRVLLNRSTNYETILLEQRKNGEKTKFIKNKYETDECAAGDFNLMESAVSAPELNQIAENTYFLPYVSTNPKFPYRMAQACIKDAEFTGLPPEIVLYKAASSKSGFYSIAGIVNINLKNKRNMAMPRESLTKAIGHEISHAKWDEKCRHLDMYDCGFIDKDELYIACKEADIPKARRYKKAIENYTSADVDMDKYRNNYAEVVAREEGQEALKKYRELDKNISSQFPYKHHFQFYATPLDEDFFMSLNFLS